jgi:hypothetical protein
MGAFLDKPITDKQSHTGVAGDLTFAVSSMQGWRIGMEVRWELDFSPNSLNDIFKISQAYFFFVRRHDTDSQATVNQNSFCPFSVFWRLVINANMA